MDFPEFTAPPLVTRAGSKGFHFSLDFRRIKTSKSLDITVLQGLRARRNWQKKFAQLIKQL
jgi:hypothetical protein